MKKWARNCLAAVTAGTMGLAFAMASAWNASAYQPSTANLYVAANPAACNKNPCVLYPKSAQLPSGRIAATFEDSESAPVGQTMPVYKSDDHGTSWSKLADFEAPAYMSGDSQYAKYTSNWTNPCLYVLPQKVGNLAEGTLLLASVVSGDDYYYQEQKAANSSWTPSGDGDRKDVALALYALSGGGVGDLHGQLSAEVRGVRQEFGDRPPALLARQEDLRQGRRTGREPAHGVRPPAADHQHDRGPRRQHGLHEFLLHPGQPQVLHVTALARGADAEHAGLVADDHHGDVGPGGGRDRTRDPGPVRLPHRAALGELPPHTREFGGQRGAQRHRLDPVAEVLAVGEDMVGEAVAAEHRADVVGARPDQRDTPGGRQRQAPGVRQQHGARPRDRVGQPPVLRLVQLQLPRAQRGRHRIPVGVEQPERELLPQHPAHRPVDVRLVGLPGAHGLHQRRTEAALVRQFHVQARPQRQSPAPSTTIASNSERGTSRRKLTRIITVTGSANAAEGSTRGCRRSPSGRPRRRTPPGRRHNRGRSSRSPARP